MSPGSHARIAGALYLIVVIAGTAALLMMSPLLAAGDPAATASKIAEAEVLYRLAFVSNLVANIAYIGVVALLYWLLKPVSAPLSAVAAAFGLVGCAVSGAAALEGLDPIFLAKTAPEQLQTLTLMLRSGAHNNNVALTFFGCYCLLLGFLVVEARFLPRVLGLVLSLAGATWLLRSMGLFLAPTLVRDVADILMAAAGIGELLFTLWLLFFGVNSANWHAQAEGA